MKILLVEDSRSLAAVIGSRLESFGNEVTLAENGQIGFDKFVQASFDLILMDIEMPVMNGFEATTRIRAHEARQPWAWTPILFLTASDTSDNIVTAIEAGGDDFIAKTVPEPVLQAKMKAMARIATLRRRLAVANARLSEQASRDGLTGLYNRRHMDLRLDAAWEQAVNRGKPFALLILDIDNFKKYNDHYGHQTGDDCLRAVAAAIAKAVAEGNAPEETEHAFAARYGGEEFVVVLPFAAHAAYEAVAVRVLAGIRALAIEHLDNAGIGTVTVSVGGAYQTRAAGRIADLFRCADQRLYRAKGNGRNQAVLAG
ncbi:diguanylate cyclase [Parasulfuritortus cantonensis]|uniref:diguanylate cyclase n=1 Tax=Parasulfuritortus cantonensis TaxID=2528202 RepID=A0A4R1BD57_9PROT|nr:diguanylate cyclase [Parasulfuritortus cantonensis]TCJ14983.1 diguanylate cyclase [Parasulfuritortus cantonensis]